MNPTSIVKSTALSIKSTASYKVLLLGDGGVGKTTFLKKIKEYVFQKQYIATMGAEVHPISFSDKEKEVIFNIWDCAGQEKFSGLRQGYYIEADAAIYMYDKTSTFTYKNIGRWKRDVERVCGTLPFIIIENKSDIDGKTINISEQDKKLIFSFSARKDNGNVCLAVVRSLYNKL